MFRVVLLLVCAGLVSACHRGTSAISTESASPVLGGVVSGASGSSAPSLLLAPEDVLTVGAEDASSGVSITGAIQPERRADLRAEVSAVVLQVLKDNGDKVRRGDLLVRLDDTAIRDTLNSAEASARAAEQAYDQAQRQYQRLVKLRETGMVSTQAVEDVEIRRDSAQSELEAAKARVVTARQQLDRTEARAPFDGVVSDRKVSAGDTAQVGKELVKVIDPRSMRFEGMVSADHVGEIRVDQQVTFRIHGFSDRTFTGKVARVNPATNATTRQVEVLVSFVDGANQSILAGLYAEGHVSTGMQTGVTIPSDAIVRNGELMFAWRIHDNHLQKVPVAVGKRDERTGDFQVSSGVANGDVLLRHPGNSKLVDGQKVELGNAAGVKTSVS